MLDRGCVIQLFIQGEDKGWLKVESSIWSLLTSCHMACMGFDMLKAVLGLVVQHLDLIVHYYNLYI